METVVEELVTNKTKTQCLTKKDLELQSVTEILKKCLESFDILLPPKKATPTQSRIK